jgi:hypothetical protein
VAQHHAQENDSDTSRRTEAPCISLLLRTYSYLFDHVFVLIEQSYGPSALESVKVDMSEDGLSFKGLVMLTADGMKDYGFDLEFYDKIGHRRLRRIRT